MRGGGGGAGPAFGPAPFLLGGVGAAKGLLPCFLVPKRNQPTACTLALWWLKFGPTELVLAGGGGFRCSWPCCLCACRPLLWSWFAVGVCVCGAVRARVVSVLVCGAWSVVCGVRRWCVGGVVAGVWCGWSLATPGGGSCVLLPATPGWVSLPVVVCVSPPLLAGVPLPAVACGVWCVVCGVW